MSLREMLTSLEEQLKSTTSSLRNSRETVADKEAEISKLRLLLEQSERSADELKRRLEKKLNELQRTESDKLSSEEMRGSYYLLDIKFVTFTLTLFWPIIR